MGVRFPSYLCHRSQAMDDIIHYIMTHQFTAGIGVFVALLILFVIFKHLLKLALLLILLFMVMCGYLYFKDPKQMPKNIHETYQKAKEQTGKMVDTGKKAYEKGKEIAEKGEKLTKDAEKFLVEKKDALKDN
jgi:ABC-type bacteriocin/lantibiotic exporter with double-glycine peptidase domain